MSVLTLRQLSRRHVSMGVLQGKKHVLYLNIFKVREKNITLKGMVTRRVARFSTVPAKGRKCLNYIIDVLRE